MDELRFNPDDPTIVIYLNYEYLTAAQLSTLVGAVNNIYESVARLLIYDAFEYVAAPNIVIHGVPLEVSRVNTAHSIELEFKLTRKKFPSIYTKEGKLGVELPQWVAVMAVTSALLMGGLHGYGEVLDVMIKRTDLELKQIELIQKARENAERETSSSAAVQSSYYQLQSAIQGKNVSEVRVNGTVIKQAPDGEAK